MIIFIVATDVLISVSKLPVSVQFTLTELRLSIMVGIVSVDITGFELRAEFLVKIKKCWLIVSWRIKFVWVDVINTLLFMFWPIVPASKTVTFHSKTLKFVLHLNDGWLPGQTDTSPVGDNNTWDSIIIIIVAKSYDNNYTSNCT